MTPLHRAVFSTLRPAALLAAIGATLALGSQAEAVKLQDWATIDSPAFGFMLAYPANVFVPDPARSTEGGHVLVSRDRRARLLVATFENADRVTLQDYRQQLMSEHYSGAQFDYTPVRKHWFVLSGTQDDTHFYYRVSLTCAGRLINSWALIYPVQERRFYDRVVEAIARTYTPGAGPAGNCE